MRYFFFAYTAKTFSVTNNGNYVASYIAFGCDNFPAAKTVIEEILKGSQTKLSPTSVVISSMFEFRNQVDFNNFIRK